MAQEAERERPYDACVLSERLMCPVAVRRRLRPLALAQGHFFGFIDRKFQRFEPGAFMCSITKRLIPRSSTGAPVIGAGLQGQD